MSTKYRQKGISLIELIMFIVIVSIGIAGILSVMNLTTKNSADPLLRKQALAIAESLLEEIELQPFTYCDPDDSLASDARGAAVDAPGAPGCISAATIQGIAPQAGESRYAEPWFDNVGDYNGFSMTGIRDIGNNAISGLEVYNASVAIVQVGGTFVFPANDVLQIDVRVQGPANTDITLTGYRFRYAPNAVP